MDADVIEQPIKRRRRKGKFSWDKILKRYNKPPKPARNPYTRHIEPDQAQRLMDAALDINSLADGLWSDQNGKPFPIRTDYKTAEALMRDLLNLVQSRAPVISPREFNEFKLLDDNGKELGFNFLHETWMTLRECVRDMIKYDISTRFDITRINFPSRPSEVAYKMKQEAAQNAQGEP